MSSPDRKTLIREYKESPRPSGIYRVRNMTTGASLVGASPDLPGILNRQRFQLEMGSHPSKDLQAEWNTLGAEAFAIEVLDELERRDEPGYDPSEDLKALKELWLERLASEGVVLYPENGRTRVTGGSGDRG